MSLSAKVNIAATLSSALIAAFLLWDALQHGAWGWAWISGYITASVIRTLVRGAIAEVEE